jgi:excisionase family DNA binding protein
MSDRSTPAPEDDPWLTVQQVSDELKLHPATVRVWINSGRLAAARAGRSWRVRRSDVDRALLSDASPGYSHQEDPRSSTPADSHGELARRDAPRKLADHILTVGTPTSEMES